VLIRRRITVLVALAGAVGALSAPWPARTATAVSAARGMRTTLAARVSAAAAPPSGAGSQLIKDVQKALPGAGRNRDGAPGSRRHVRAVCGALAGHACWHGP
jgi:hypothetical protein